MTALAAAALGLAGLWLLPRPLAAARWTYRFPRAGIAAWLLLFPATAGTLLAAGLTMALHLLLGPRDEHVDEHVGGPALDGVIAVAETAVVLGGAVAVAMTVHRAAVARRSHLRDLALVARPTAHLDVLVVDAAQPAAYAVPGRPGAVVLTTAARDVLSRPELAAVLEHERAHLRARHDRLLTVAGTFAAAAPWIPAARVGHRALRVLAEMHADDAAARRTSPFTTASALVKLAGTARPAGSLGVAGTDVAARVERLLGRAAEPRTPGRWPMLLGLAGLTVLAAVPGGVVALAVAAATQS
ncbi:M56 family metallopeptidase [Jiangella alkaliphila]|uniref:Zn-dependent protease with chaperone function n=1 Tax=Jiangella alkaliphila TaxID=419479 RepID=A0A1H2L2A9_9ACTN|nr:M56 family metallopeptidase [Jiangella alkaliphila]SDU74676.1 Zn-dependent protease with chaperone function [Jiangella alkaliphila]